MTTESLNDTATNDYLFDLQGYRILKNALSPEQVATINAWIDAQPEKQFGEWIGNVEVHTYSGNEGVNYQNIIEAGPVFEELIDNPAWMGDIGRYICNDYNHLSINEAFVNVRGQGGFIGIHSGGHNAFAPATFRAHNGKWMVGQINVLMALNDIGPGDGATTIVPCSHKSHEVHPDLLGGDQQVYRSGEAAGGGTGMMEVHLKAGDAVMFTDALAHGSSARTHPGQRRIMIYRYSPHSMLQRFNYVPSEELIARLTPERRKMIMVVPPRMAPGRTLAAGALEKAIAAADEAHKRTDTATV